MAGGGVPSSVPDGGAPSVASGGPLALTRSPGPRATSASIVLAGEQRRAPMVEIERDQRRRSPRARISLPVVLSNFDHADPDVGGEVFASVRGESIDISEGGCRVLIDGRFPTTCDPTVMLHLTPTEDLLA